jgi:hypothetical protein
MNDPVIYNVNPNTLTEVDIDLVDRSLVTSFSVDGQFTPNVDSVELYYYDEGKRLIRYDYNYTTWTSHLDPTLSNTSKLEDLYIDPVEDGKLLGVVNGIVYLQYQFVTNQLNSNSNRLFYINSISTDRTEITLKSNDISSIELSGSLNTFLQQLNTNTGYFNEFYLNFGNNNKEIGVNIRATTNSPNNVEILVKLYKALPLEFDIKSTLWIQTFLADPVAYKVEYDEILDFSDNVIRLKGPNTLLKVNGQESKNTNYQTFTSLKTTSSSSLLNQVNSLLEEKGVDLNIDYTDFSNFVHFSNAKKRLENFYYKASLIEQYQTGIDIIKTVNTSSYQASSLAISESIINNIISNFDGYEYYLYYSSESKAWPKTNSTPPFTLASTGSVQALTWYGSDALSSPYYGGELFTASYYDNENQDNLLYSIPEFLREDESNKPYETFIEMIGQYFDNLFLYTEQITAKYNADNRLDSGISKDLVADTLRSFGLNIYENNFTTEDLYTALTGLTPSGSIIPLPSITTTYPVTGSGVEYIQTIISASNDIVTLDDLNKSVYKRLYHNLPLLVKKKGTLAGLQLLVNNFGIPNTILRINEFGGKDKLSSTWDQWQQQYNYGYNTKGIGFVTSSFVLNSNWNATSDNPQSIEFRFKTPGIPNTTHYSQSLWSSDTGAVLSLKYTGSGITSGSYSGSVVDPYYQYGVLEFYPSSSNLTTTASIYLPFFDGDWWSILINKNSNTNFTVYAKNKPYNGESGYILGFQASSSVNSTNPWNSSTISYLATSSFSAKNFSGSLQELRYYTQPVSESTFDAYVMNPSSIEQSEFLAFRAALGGELYTASVSIHPKVSGEQVTTSSFSSNSTYFTTSSGEFISNVETVFYDQVASGIKNVVSNRIKIGGDAGYGTVLSNQITIQQHTGSTTYTPNVNYLEVGFSPQNEINEDINSQFGYFNIGEYIGDPRFISESNYRYPALDTLSLDYFKKYSNSYNFSDYFRLIKFFDNSLFKLIKDFIPARTAAATGAIVKQHLLERNRQRPAQLDYTQPEYTGSVTSLARDYQTGSIEVFTGGAGGSVNVLTNISQSWTSSILTKAGLVTEIESSQYEFFNGEYSGSSIDVVNNKLQDNPLLGVAYKVSIPDLQNLTVKSATFLASASLFDGSNYYSTGSVRFNNLINYIDYYNTGTYKYTPNYNTQADIVATITGSIISGSQETGELFVYLYENGEPVAFTSYYTTTSNQQEAFTLTLTVPDYYITSGSTYEIKYLISNNFPLPTTTASINSNSTWTVSVDNLAAQSTYYLDPTVYTQQNFPGDINDFSDYNTILNNVYSNRVSSVYYDVDYSTNALNPVNFQTIISQSAIYAQVQDSNYTSGSAWTKARYNGTKLRSATYNTYTAGDISYGQTAVIDKYTDYFLYFSNIEEQTPDLSLIPYGGNVRGVALISIDGDVISLTPDNQNLGLVRQIFGVFDTVKAIFPAQYLGTNLSTLTLSVIIAGGIQNYLETFNILTSTPDETNIFLGVIDSTPATVSTLTTPIFSDSAGYLVPENFNVNYLNKISDIAKQAGFPIN